MAGEAESGKTECWLTEDRYLTRWVAAVFIVSIAVYANTLFNGFVYDDVDQVVANPWIRSGEHIGEIFSSGSWAYSGVTSNYYRPVMHLLYMFGYAVFGLVPAGFHAMNILFHGGVSILVVIVTAHLLRDQPPPGRPPYRYAPGIAGLLFATHPIHTEAVAWISGIPDLAFSFFGLLAFFLYLIAPEEGKRIRSIPSLLSLGFFFVALLSKETALVLPLLLVVYEVAVRKENSFRDSFARVAPYGVPLLILFLLRTAAIGTLAPVARHQELSPYHIVLNVFPLFFEYAAKLILPVRLSVFHGFQPVTSLFNPAVLASVVFAAMVLVAAEMLRRRSGPALFGLALIVVPLIPVLYIPYLGENPLAERYLYFPSIGFVMLVALGLRSLSAASGRSTFFVILASLSLVALYSAETVARNTVWKSDRTLWQDTVMKSPDAPIAHFNYGAILQGEGDMAGAIDHYLTALKIRPSEKVCNNLGLAYDSMGRTEEAIEQFRMAIRLNPDFVMAYNNLGVTLLHAGAFTEAIEPLQAAIRLKPRYADAYYNLGVGYEALGLRDKAMDNYRQAAELAPGNEQFRVRLEEFRENRQAVH